MFSLSGARVRMNLIQEFSLLLKLQKKGGICYARSNLVSLAESRSLLVSCQALISTLLAERNLQEGREKMNVRLCAKSLEQQRKREGGKVQSKGTRGRGVLSHVDSVTVVESQSRSITCFGLAAPHLVCVYLALTR